MRNELSDVQSRNRLSQLIADLAVVRGKVVLSSRMEADYYVDLRRVTLHHEASGLIGRLMLKMIDQAGLGNITAVGGLTMGADPVAMAILNAAAQQNRAVDAFVVRKSQKTYGMGRQVEGPDVVGRSVVVLEDTATTGSSAQTAVEALRAAGAHVKAVAVIMDRDTGAREYIERENNIAYLSLFSKSDVGLE